MLFERKGTIVPTRQISGMDTLPVEKSKGKEKEKKKTGVKQGDWGGGWAVYISV